MTFVSVDELRTKSAHVWKMLTNQNEMVVTRHGRPIAVLSSVNEDNFEAMLSTVRRARAMQAVNSLQPEGLF